MEANGFGILMSILAIIGMGIGVWATRAKNESSAKLKEVEATSTERISVAEISVADAETARREAEAQLAERQFIVDSHKRQIVINDQLNDRLTNEKELYEKRLADKEKQDEDNYQVLKKTQDRIGAEIQGVLKQRFDKIDNTLNDLPGKLQNDNKEWVQTLVGELVTQMAERFAEFTMAQEWYPFPDFNDPEWREDFVKPLVNKVRLYRRPVLSDASLSDVSIMPTGETMEIIQGRKKGWLVVRLPRGTKALYGWLPEHEVMTGVAALKRTTSEVPTTVSTSAIPAT